MLQLHRARRAFSLIEILIVLVVLAILSAITFSVVLGKGGSKTARSYGPTAKAHESVCTENLRQIRMGITMQHDSDADGKYPQSLSELKFPHESLICPDDKQPYQYDPETGQVSCVHPGHEKY